jgi:signal transduction histidine kinase
MLTGAVVYALYHYRVTQLIELERVRTRIATDLHDDIGSNLSQIAIMSEVARGQIARGDTSATQQLSLIARISRESVDAMSDIVWAINPQRDWLSDLTGRMRRFAGEICPGRNIDFHFQAYLPDQDLRLGADVRRQTYLIFKECLNNLVRHSACSRANIELCVEADWLIMKLSDNGRGFDPATSNGGHGLANMRRRAASLGGDLRIVSAPGRGTTITLKIPYGHTGRMAPLRRRVEAEAEDISADQTAGDAYLNKRVTDSPPFS